MLLPLSFLLLLAFGSPCLTDSTQAEAPNFQDPTLHHPEASNQAPLNEISTKGHVVRPYISEWLWPKFLIDLSIGTPPQNFSVVIELSEDFLLIPSVDCYWRCEEGFHRYNSSSSSSYKKGYDSTHLSSMDVVYKGPLSKDTVHLSNIEISDQLFMEWTDSTCTVIGCIEGPGFDGTLGLAPPWRRQEFPLHPLVTLLGQNHLESPVFSLKLPRFSSEEGELLFGSTNPALYTPPLLTISVIQVAGEEPGWNVRINSITLETPNPIHRKMPSYYGAIIITSFPYLAIPDDLAKEVADAIGTIDESEMFPYIPCDSREHLPMLTFNLGGNRRTPGYNFSISAFDYTWEIVSENGTTYCLSAITGNTNYGLSPDVIMLGSSFLKGHYTVFDMDKREISLAPVKP